MPTAARTIGKYRVTPLRQAQRDLTRGRIRDAARALFAENHYDATTIEQIATRAGLQRSTVYLHYRDKGEILAGIVADYTPRAAALVATLPGPKPSVAQLVRWIEGLGGFFEAERTPLSIIMEVWRIHRGAPYLEDLLQSVLEGLGRNSTAFRAAAEGGDPALRARAVLLVNQFTWVGETIQAGATKEWAAALRLAIAEAFHEFLTRFDDA